jgi:hypothetical protein
MEYSQEQVLVNLSELKTSNWEGGTWLIYISKKDKFKKKLR